MDLTIPAVNPDPSFSGSVASGIPIIVDNGSYICRAGYASKKEPHLVFKNMIYKHRLKRNSLLVGNDIADPEAVRNSIRSAFDRGVVVQYEIQEHVFDHIFSRLRVKGDRVSHPVVISEPPSNPSLCRAQMSELLFDCYRVPKVAYFIDGLASRFHNSQKPDGLVLSFGYHAVTLLPYLDGRLQAPHHMRLNVGGCDLESFMQRLIQLKYPCHTTRVTQSISEKIVHNTCKVIADYKDINRWRDPSYRNENTMVLNLPYLKMENKLSEEQIRKKREMQIVKLRDARQKRQTEKLKKETAALEKLQTLRDIAENGYSSSFRPKNKTEAKNFIKKSLKEAGLKDVESLEKRILHVRRSVRRLESQMRGDNLPPDDDEEEDNSKQSFKEPVLLDVPDDELTPEERKVKRRQMMLRAAALRREQIRAFKEKQRKKLVKAVEELEETRGEDFLAWITSLRYQRLSLLDARQSRKKCKVSDNERRIIQQQRIRLMTDFQLGKLNLDLTSPDAEEQEEEESSDSEAEHEQLMQLETLLAQYDPEFSKELGGDGLKADLADYYRMFLTSERHRVPEALFQPALIGCDQSGLAEAVEHLFRAFSAEEQQRLASQVLLTGGVANMPGLRDRVEAELRQIRPFGSELRVELAGDPSGDAWHGARAFALSSDFEAGCITRAQYDEMGHDYLQEHVLSNIYFADDDEDE